MITVSATILLFEYRGVNAGFICFVIRYHLEHFHFTPWVMFPSWLCYFCSV